MITRTKSVLVDETTLTPEVKAADGGRAALLEVFALIRENKQVGELVVQFGQGGSVSSMKFKETTLVTQADRKDWIGLEVTE